VWWFGKLRKKTNFLNKMPLNRKNQHETQNFDNHIGNNVYRGFFNPTAWGLYYMSHTSPKTSSSSHGKKHM